MMMVDVKERPLLMSGPMVRAILEGRKSQTRRVVSDATSQGNHPASCLLLNDPSVFVDPGPSPAGNAGPYLHAPINCEACAKRYGWALSECDPSIRERLYPRYAVGDRLWVRETWAAEPQFDHLAPADFPVSAQDVNRVLHGNDIIRPFNKARSSIHMPRWASRLTLEITGVKVERLCDISEADAEAEGFAFSRHELPELSGPIGGGFSIGGVVSTVSASGNFLLAWDALNEKRGYGSDTNPWVFVIEFKRVSP